MTAPPFVTSSPSGCSSRSGSGRGHPARQPRSRWHPQITGDDRVAGEVLRAVVIETATSDLGGRLAVVVDDELAELSAAFITRTALVSGAWTVAVASERRARLEPLGIELQPQRVSDENLAALCALLRTSVPLAPQVRPERAVAQDTVETLRASTPIAEDTNLPSEVMIGLPGQIEFHGLPAAAGGLSPRSQDLLAYLALHGPTTGADLDDVLWNGARISQGTRNALVYRTRQKVGDAVLPRLDDRHYALGSSVTTDWTLFQRHVARGLHSQDTAERIAELSAAIALVRERRFRGIASGRFTWADLDIQVMCSAIADAALALGQLLHGEGRDHDAFDVATRGPRVEPYSEPLQELAVTAVEATTGPEAATRTRLGFIEAPAALDAESV